MSALGSSVCVVGSVNMDLVIRAQRIPTPGETVLGGGYRTFAGGKGANQAVAAARLGSKVSFIGCIGSDQHAPRLRDALQGEGIDLSGLRTREKDASGLALITTTETDNTIVVAPGANATLGADDVEAYREAIERSEVLLMQLEVPLPAVEAAAKIARGAGRCVMLNAAPARTLPPSLLALVDVLIVNQPEAMRLLNIEAKLDPARLALRLPELGPTCAIMTVGASGAIASYKGRPRRINAPSVKVVDTVGAGDAFCGALASRWGPVHKASQARDTKEFSLMERATDFAAAAGAIATTRPGAIAAMPSLEEVERVVERA